MSAEDSGMVAGEKYSRRAGQGCAYDGNKAESWARNYLDNAVAESFVHTLMKECLLNWRDMSALL